VKAFRVAAELGHAGAQYLLAIAYHTGRGVDLDYQEARHWFEASAQQGHGGAQYQLGDIYLNGRGVVAEKAWGMHWIGRAADRGDANAQFAYGVGWLQGVGLPKDQSRGLFWLLVAQRQGRNNLDALLLRLKQQSPNPYSEAKTLSAGWTPALGDERDSSHRIRYLQFRLIQEGYAPGPADGLWGAKTELAVRDFCRENGISCQDFDKTLLKEMREGGRIRSL
jgi:TPR repeat protein